MRHPYFTAILAAALSVTFLSVPSHASPAHVPGRLLVVAAHPDVFADGARGLRARSTRVATALASQGLERIERIVPNAVDGLAGRHVYRIEGDASLDVAVAAQALLATGEFAIVSPDYVLELHGVVPNDTYYANQQWYMEDVLFHEAWSGTTGDSNVVIAIMDNGVDPDHPDLVDRMWTHPVETLNGIDDDGNGYIDDIHGWDFGSNDATPYPERRYDSGGIDVGFHGTFCAGIAAAAGDNGIGMAGAAWNARIMALKVSHPDTGITLSAVAPAFAYAADQGADILSMSFGGKEDSLGTIAPFFQALVDVANAAGVLCIASAGNDSTSNPSYPAASNGVLAVGATDDMGNRAFFSQWGPWVDISAPGVLIFSAIGRNYAIDPLDAFIYALLFGYDSTNPYMYGNGTSFAAPLVAGAAAMVKGLQPGMTNAELLQHMIDTGDVETFDLPIGVKLNALAAVGPFSVSVGDPFSAPSLHLAAVSPNPFQSSTTLHFTTAVDAPATVEVFDAFGRRVRTLHSGWLPAGSHSLSWDGRDHAGNVLANGVYLGRLQSAGERVSGKLVLLGR